MKLHGSTLSLSSPLPCTRLQLSSHAILTNVMVMMCINFATDEHLELADYDHMGLDGNRIMAYSQWEASSAVILTIHGTSFYGLSIAYIGSRYDAIIDY